MSKDTATSGSMSAVPSPIPPPPQGRLPHPSQTGETDIQRALRIALAVRESHEELREGQAVLKAGQEALENMLGRPPNPVTGFAGSGLHVPLARVLQLTEELTATRKKRDEWTVWALRVVLGALLLAAVAGGLAWVGGLHH
jgi:hypothetical protein